jgi:uncharacterized membrane-anchored protein YhcB (DUF1043 family)
MFRLLKVKPPNGWNAVGWELAIVVIGVFVALVAQEWATNRAHQAKARHSLEAIKRELANHYAWSVEWRVVTPCLLSQIDQLQQRVMSSGANLEPAPVTYEKDRHFVVRLPAKEYETSAWNAAQLDGVVARFEPAVRTELSSHYEQVRLIAEHSERNGIDYRRLLTLSRPIPLDPVVRYSLLQTLDELRGRVEFMDLLSGQLIDHVLRLDFVPPAAVARNQVQRLGTYPYCLHQRLRLRSFAQAMTPVPN